MSKSMETQKEKQTEEIQELANELFSYSGAILNFVIKSNPNFVEKASANALEGYKNKSQFLSELNKLREMERNFRNKLQEISRKTGGQVHFSNAKGVANFLQDTANNYKNTSSEVYQKYWDAKNYIDKSAKATETYAKAAALANHLGNGINAYQMADAWHEAVTEGNWNNLGRIIGAGVATLWGGIAIGFVAGVAGYYAAKGAAWLWDKLFGDDYANLPRDDSYYIVDPLALDIDGDGIKTVGINGLDSTLFDHNKDGIKTATGWVGKDDALLGVDLDGDGEITNGRELFGDNHLLENGERAETGYQALGQYDDNGDGRIDAQDAVFGKLRAWRDANQDGISQADELLTMEEAQVQALNLAHSSPNRNLGNGNTLARMSIIS